MERGAQFPSDSTSRLEGLVRRVGLFFDQAGAERAVDAPLEIGAAIVGPIDRAGQLDETRAEVVPPLALADVVLDLPEFLVDGTQFRLQRHEFGRWRQRAVVVP